MIEVASVVAHYVGAKNAHFDVSRFEDWNECARYDVVLSLANHSTHDKNTSQDISDYFRRCAAVTQPGGLLVFESHPPAHEGKNLDNVVQEIVRYFTISSRRVPDYGTFLDRGRTFIVATKR